MRWTTIAAILLACAVPFHIASASSSAPQLTGQRTIVLKISDLRSAYLQRAGIVRYDRTNLSPDGVRQQLQRHFDVVLGVLLVATPRSIEAALDRLEATDDRAWTQVERSAWRKKLLAARYLQMRRLIAYRDRGLFPLNEGQADHPAPIFVDRHDTACAVGQLMRWSGWDDEVAEIARTNDLVYVPDARNSSVASWILTSGLTVEEAALIQPTYPFYTPYAITQYAPGELSLIKNGLKYENFHIEAQNFTPGPLFPGLGFHQSVDLFGACNGCSFTPVSGGFLLNMNGVGFNAGEGLIGSSSVEGSFDPIGTNWIVIGGYVYRNQTYDDLGLHGSSQSAEIQRIVVSFDVSTTVANSFIDQIAEHSYPLEGGFRFGMGTREYEFTTTASHSGSTLASTQIEDDPTQIGMLFPPAQSASADLASPTHSLSVSTTIWLYNGVEIDSYLLGFRVVPEPTGSLLIFVGFVLTAMVPRIRCLGM